MGTLVHKKKNEVCSFYTGLLTLPSEKTMLKEIESDTITMHARSEL